jgi:hypothetical protein
MVFYYNPQQRKGTGAMIIGLDIFLSTVIGLKLTKEHRRQHYDIEGIVIEESFKRDLAKVPEYHYSGFISEAHSNETVTIEPNYLITMKVTKSEVDVPDTIIIDVSYDKEKAHKMDEPTKEGLEKLLKKGSKIAIQSKCSVNNKSYLINRKTYEIKVIKP